MTAPAWITAFEQYLHNQDIEHTLCKVGQPQSNGTIEQVYQTYEKQSCRYDTVDEFLYLVVLKH